MTAKSQSNKPELREKSYTLKSSVDLDPLLERIDDAHFVLLGEASHGTHEFYTWRTAITKRLIAEKGFNFIAVEGDWPDCYRINRFIKGYDSQEKTEAEILKNFQRWPSWMWANWEIAALVHWLKDYNTTLPTGKKTGFYGLDVYSLWESLEALIAYLQKIDPPAARMAQTAMSCFERHGRDEQNYARYSMTDSCRDEAIKLLTAIRKKSLSYDQDPEAAINTSQNAFIAVEAEKYYRSMVSFDDHSWNIRDKHMMETLKRLIDFHSPVSKAIIWEHNTHIGDARFTDMEGAGMVNVGQLVREYYGPRDTVLVGFGSYSGTVIAGNEWSAPMEEMIVPPARKGSIEEILHTEKEEDRLLIFNREGKKERFSRILPHRAIGVVYHPQSEHGNYVPSVISARYDAFVFIDQTKALHPIPVSVDQHQVPETYPFEF
jgi:erythromycin esterase